MTESKRELTNQELDNACGGDSDITLLDIGRATSIVENSKGRRVGEYIDGILYYQPCEVCKKPLWLNIYKWDCAQGHFETLWPTLVPWTGTEEDLKAASL